MDDNITAAVPSIYGVTQNGSGQYLVVMQLAEDGTLDNAPPFLDDWNEILYKAFYLAFSLALIHLHDCTHYDLHPGNVAFLSNNLVPLLDLGLTRSLLDVQPQTGVYGRLDYFPPEAFSKDKQFTQAYDIYCLGTLLWQLVTRVPPRNTAAFAICNRPDQMRDDPIPDAPEAYTDIIKACWSPDPRQPMSALALL